MFVRLTLQRWAVFPHDTTVCKACPIVFQQSCDRPKQLKNNKLSIKIKHHVILLLQTETFLSSDIDKYTNRKTNSVKKGHSGINCIKFKQLYFCKKM